MGDKWELSKLSTENYSTWKTKLNNYLIAKDLFDYFDESITAPATAASDKEKKDFASKEAKAYSHIVLEVSEELLFQ